MNENACLVCGAELKYHDISKKMKCKMCGKTFESNAECANGHYVCDGCHSDPGVAAVKAVCFATDSKNPFDICNEIMGKPGVHMHGPEHHFIVAASLLTAYRNSGGNVNLEKALDEAVARGKRVPGGVCGMMGCCGAAVSAGIFYSIITGTTPMSSDTWGTTMMLTSKCLERIASTGGPRCCKRDSYASTETAVGYVKETLGIRMEYPEHPVCSYGSSNPQCLGKACPYAPSNRIH
jgi:hypothetical protein